MQNLVLVSYKNYIPPECGVKDLKAREFDGAQKSEIKTE
jgi:hypothetical protein